MSLLADTLGKAKQGVIDTGARLSDKVQRTAKDAVENVQAIPERAIEVGTQGLQQAADAGLGAARGAVSDLLRGDTSAAAARFSGLGGSLQDIGRGTLDRVAGLPGQAIDNALMGLNVSSLRGPGIPEGISVSSYNNGGVQPGNALAGALARADPLMSFLWYCQPPTLIGDGVASNLPWFYVEEASLPFRTYETRQIYREGRPRTYAGKYSVSDLQLTFYLDVGGVAMSYLTAWDNLIVAPFNVTDKVEQGGRFRMPSVYLKDIPIYILNVNKQELVQIVYTECWPTNLASLSLQSQASERLVAQVTFSVGDVFVSTQTLGDQQMSSVLESMARVSEGVPSSGVTTYEPAQTFPVNL